MIASGEGELCSPEPIAGGLGPCEGPSYYASGEGELCSPEPIAGGLGPCEGPSYYASGEGELCSPEPIAGGLGPCEGPKYYEARKLWTTSGVLPSASRRDRRILPEARSMPMTFTSISSPSLQTSCTVRTRFSSSSLMCTRPSVPGRISTKAPNSAMRRTTPL